MSEWIPLIQTLVWPTFITIFLFFARSQVAEILKSISTRIERGDSFQAGPSGISLGQSENKLTRLNDIVEPNDEQAKPTQIVEPSHAELPVSVEGKIEMPVAFESNLTISPDEVLNDSILSKYENVIYLIHSALGPYIDTDGVERHSIQIIVDADSENILDEIERVVYHLHPTFPNPNRETTDRKSRFELKTRAWGEFNLSASVYLKDYKNPLKLHRYLNFQNF